MKVLWFYVADQTRILSHDPVCIAKVKIYLYMQIIFQWTLLSVIIRYEIVDKTYKTHKDQNVPLSMCSTAQYWVVVAHTVVYMEHSQVHGEMVVCYWPIKCLYIWICAYPCNKPLLKGMITQKDLSIL